MQEPRIRAEGTNGVIELLQDSVLLQHKGRFGQQGEATKEIPIKYIESIKSEVNFFDGGYLQLLLGGQQEKRRFRRLSKDPYTVLFTYGQRKPFKTLTNALEQRIAERGRPAEVPETSLEVEPEAVSEAADVPATSVSKVAGGVEVLSKKLKKLTEQNTNQEEDIKFCLVSRNIGGWSQAIVALNDRLLVIKPGMAAGATFGARVTSFYYRDITGIEVNTGLMQGVIEINTPSYQGTAQKDFWSTGKNNNPHYITNCLPISKQELKDYKPYIDRLRTMIREAKQERGTPPPTQDSGNLVAQLEKLASLRSSGVLSEDEFQQAKKGFLAN